MSKRPYKTPDAYRVRDERDLYEESYWDSVGRKPPTPEGHKHPGGRPKGSKDAKPRRRRYAKKPTTEVSDGSIKEKRNHNGGNDMGRS